MGLVKKRLPTLLRAEPRTIRSEMQVSTTGTAMDSNSIISGEPPDQVTQSLECFSTSFAQLQSISRFHPPHCYHRHRHRHRHRSADDVVQSAVTSSRASPLFPPTLPSSSASHYHRHALDLSESASSLLNNSFSPHHSIPRLHHHYHLHQHHYFHHHHLLLIVIFIIATSISWTIAIGEGYTAGEPYQTSANRGENVILRCVFDFPDGFRVPYVIQWEKQGVKIPIYIWYDGYPPHMGEGYQGRVSLTGQASLNLSNVRESDQGWYECKVFFLNRPPEPIKNGTWAHLDVLAPPQFHLKPPDVIYVKVGESITLPCEATGTPTPQIVWYKDNRPLQSNSNFHILTNELRITSIQLNDIGEYRCTSRNREGSISTTTKIIIAGPAVITLPPHNLTKLEGDRVEFVCEAKALPSNVTHRWFHNGVEISHLPWMENRVSIKHGTLLINPSIGEDSGSYTCEVSNGIGLPDTAEAFLNIEYPARVVYSPTIQYLPLGLSGIVRCYIQASPPFQFVTWTKDRRPFDPNSTPGVLTLNNGSLLFNRISHEHQGIYRCTPYNIHGSSEASQGMEVLVRDPPVFVMKPSLVYTRIVNDEVLMPCDGTGQPKPNIYWRKANDTKLSRERSILRAGNLTIKSLKKEDHGYYECVLENEIATIVASTLLIVNNTTPHTPTEVSANASYFAATIHWQPNYNGGHEQTFHLSYRISDQGDAEWKTIRVPPPETTNTFTLYNLQSDTEYEFQVYASNRLGSGTPTPSIRSTTKAWSFGEKIYPTDASGATYIPTVQKPSGPKPDPPRNLTLEKMAQGWVLSWLAPVNRTVTVAYYRVEYRQLDQSWQYTDPIPYDTAYLFKTLEPNSRYIFRVWAYSILGVGDVSEMIEVNLSGFNDPSQNSRAIAAAVIGSVLFFVIAIVLATCAVKICNKRKRKKIEKSYMMVTCPVNGAHSYGDSPVPSKQYSSAGDVITRQQYYDDEYDNYRNYWQRPAFGTGFLAGRSDPQAALHVWSQNEPIQSSTTTADVHHDDAAFYWSLRNADNATQPIWPRGQSTDVRPLPSSRRRAMKNLQYSMEAGLTHPLGSKFGFNKSKETEPIIHNYDLTPSNQASVRGSFRSDGSGQSQVRRPYSQLSYAGSNANPTSESEFVSKPPLARSSLHSSLSIRPQTLLPYHRQISSIYHPQAFPTSSPTSHDFLSNFPQSFGSINRVISTIKNPSILADATTLVDGHTVYSKLHELPSLRPIHKIVTSQQSTVGRQSVQFSRPTLDGSSSLRATVPIGRNISQFAGRILTKRPPLLEPVPEAIYDIAQPANHQRREDLSYLNKQYNPYQNLPVPKHLLVPSPTQLPTSSQPKIFRPLPLHPVGSSYQRPPSRPIESVGQSKRQGKDEDNLNLTSSSNSSSEQQFEYTRDKLLGAVEKVRSGYLLSRSSPYRHTIEERNLLSYRALADREIQDQTIRPISAASQQMPHSIEHKFLPVNFIDGASYRSGKAPIISSINPAVPTHSTYQSEFKLPPKSIQIASQPHVTHSEHLPRFAQTDSKFYIPNKPPIISYSTLPEASFQSSKIQHDPSSGSSGFISGTSSALLKHHSTNSPGQSSGISAEGSTPVHHTAQTRPLSVGMRTPSFPSPPTYSQIRSVMTPQQQIQSSRSHTPHFEHESFMGPLDISVDENYEFDAASPLDSENIEKLKRDPLRWSHWQTWHREQGLVPGREQRLRQQFEVDRGQLSDTEDYSKMSHQQPQYHSYRIPRNMTLEDMEARCAALKREFLSFRHRQNMSQNQQGNSPQPLHQQQQQQQKQFPPQSQLYLTSDIPGSTSSSDEFESAC